MRLRFHCPFLLVLTGQVASCGAGASSPASNCATPLLVEGVTQQMQTKRGTMGTSARAMVASGHTRATQIGVDTLRHGGNAVDAFVATVLAEDLVLPGVTSTAGLAGFLVYQADTKMIYYVHGPLKSVATAGGTGVGGKVLLPGAVSAMAFASRHYGRLPLADVMAPVIALARQGFPIDGLFARSIAANRDMLARSAYGQTAFFRAGVPLVEGDALAQPEVAATLEGIASLGEGYFYRGAWASSFVTAVNAAGGRAALADLSGYQPFLVAPLTANYRGYQIYTSAGYSSGGASLLLALKTLEHVDLKTLGNFDVSVSSLELLARVHDAVSAEPWLRDPAVLLQPSDAQARIARDADELWQKISAGQVPPVSPAPGSHSSAVIVVDEQGNMVVGTHTINTTNWGLGLFVGGLPLATAADNHPDLGPAAFALDPLSSEIVVIDHTPRVALSTFGTGLSPGDLQVMSRVLDFNLSPEDAVLLPRLGFYAHTSSTSNGMTTFTVDNTRHQLDLRVSPAVVCAARAAGVGLVQESEPGASAGFVDTGFPVLVTLDAEPGPARLKGMTPEWLSGSAAGF